MSSHTATQPPQDPHAGLPRWSAAVGLASAIVLGCFAFGRWPAAMQVALWMLAAASAALLFRGALTRLFGPVLFYDMVRTARRGRFVLMRVVYLCLLLTILLMGMSAGQSMRAPKLRDAARVSEAYFWSLMTAQMLAVCLLTPAYTAGAVSEEKRRRTLEFLLATDLANREIVLGKLISRLANVGLFVLAGLPLMGLMQLLGGVEPDLVLAGFVVSAVTALSLGGVSIWFSVRERVASRAIAATYLVFVAYLVSCLFLKFVSVSLGSTPSSATATDLVDAYGSGNIFTLIAGLQEALSRPQGVAMMLPGLVGRYALFHTMVALASTVWAVLDLRSQATREASRAVRPTPRLLRTGRRRNVTDQPMLWKELSTAGGLPSSWAVRIAWGALVALSFVPAIYIMFWHVVARNPGRLSPPDDLAVAMNVYVRAAGTVVACVTLLAVSLRAAGAISGERERQTWESLLTTPLETDDILAAKFLGAVLGVRGSWFWMGMIWAIGVVTGGLSPVAVPLLALTWLVLAAFAVLVGLNFSIRARTTQRAAVATLATLGGLVVGPWFLRLSCCLSAASGLWEFQLFALTPPATLAVLAFTTSGEDRTLVEPSYFLYIVLGLVIWAVGAAALWALASWKLGVLTGRVPASDEHDAWAAAPRSAADRA